METIRFLLNGRPAEVDAAPGRTLLDLLRGPLGLPGTKEGCGEGDCGACTVVLGQVEGGRVRYRPATSCLVLAPTIRGRLVVTVEGLAEGDRLHPVQQALVDAQAIQCGYCTPGVVMSLFALFLEDPAPDGESLRAALEGNLCRCTGYVAIRDAGTALAAALQSRATDPAALRPAWLDAAESALLSGAAVADAPECREGHHLRYESPVDAAGVDALLARHGTAATVLNGGTDVVVGMRVKGVRPSLLVDLSRVPGLADVAVGPAEAVVGGTARLEDVRVALRDAVPVLSAAIRVMCSRQVRCLATLAGNVANASPVADTVPVLMALGAALRLRSAAGVREVPVDAFFRGYRDTVRRPDEWIESVRIPRPGTDFADFQKASRRAELDISAVNSALRLRLEGDVVVEARLAFGGAGPTAVLSRSGAQALVGRPFTEASARAAGEAALQDVSPIGDVRGGADHRAALVRNLPVAHWRAWARLRGPAGGVP